MQRSAITQPAGILTFCFLLSLPFAALAQPVAVETFRNIPPHDAGSFLKLLHVSDPAALTVASLEEDPTQQVPSRSHLRVHYSSAVPVPLKIEMGSDPPLDAMLTAVLPPAKDGDALIDLTASPLWRPGIKPVNVQFFSVAGHDPKITDIVTENRLSWLQSAIAMLRQPFMNERFSATSLGMINGYSVAGRPLVMIAGILLLIACGWLLIRRRGLAIRPVTVLCLCALGLYGLRFGVNYAVATAMDAGEFVEHGNYNDMGFLYTSAMALQKDIGADPHASVFACISAITPLKYYLSPVAVSGDVKDLPAATHGLFTLVWDDAQHTFTCNGLSREGKIIRRFPSGEAVVRFTKPQ